MTKLGLEHQPMKSVVVTGVSTGTGWGIAKVLLANGFRVFGSVRKHADAERLKAEFGANFVPLLFDTTDEAAVLATAREVRAALKGETLAGLVNNAGVLVPGPLLELPVDEFRRQIEVNLIGHVIVTRAFAPLLGIDPSLKGPSGRIVMMSSIAGRNALPFLGAYAASKHGLEGLSESLRRELMLYGIDVIIIGPGVIDTPIWAKTETIDIAPYKKSRYFEALGKARGYGLKSGRNGLPVERVAELVYRALTTAVPRARYGIVPDRARQFLSSALPKRLVDYIIARRLRLTRKHPKIDLAPVKSVVITGVSSGIGRATAAILVGRGYRVFGSVLSRAEAETASEELGPNFLPLVFDITDETTVRAAAQDVRAALGGRMLSGLINNAGIALPPQPLLATPIEELRRLIEVNLTGQLTVTQAFAPLLGADATLKGEPGRILMMSSINGKIGWPLGAPYSAAKHALEGLSESLRRELPLYGIDVVIIAPAEVNTPIWAVADAIDIERFRETPYREPLERIRGFMLKNRLRGLAPERVGRLVHRVLAAKRPRVRYAISPIPAVEFMLRVLPKLLSDRLIAGRFRLLPHQRRAIRTPPRPPCRVLDRIIAGRLGLLPKKR